MVQAAAKGMLNVDDKQREKNMIKTARARLRLVVWQFRKIKKKKTKSFFATTSKEKKKNMTEIIWVDFDKEASFSLELGRMSGNIEFSIISKAFTKPVHINLDTLKAREESSKNFSIRRKVRSLGLKVKDSWLCTFCKKRTSNDMNACVFCGKVKGH